MKNLRTQEEIMQNWKGDVFKPKVSICCITYNHEKYINYALEGFLIQETDFPFEIIIHDDASTDRTAEIIRDFENNYPLLIKPIYQKKNQFSLGANPFWEHNFAKANGKYIAPCEGDDYWINADKLQSQFTILEANPDLGMVHTDVLLIDSENQPIDPSDNYNRYKYRIRQGYIFWDLLINGNSVFTVSVMIRKNLIKRYSEWFYFDYWLFLDVSRQALVYFINDKMVAYRKHQGGIMLSDPSYTKKRAEWVRLDIIHRYIFRKDSNWKKSNKDFDYIRCTEILIKLIYSFCCKKLILPKLLSEILIKKPFVIFGIIYNIPILIRKRAIKLYFQFLKSISS
ncbi:MAG: glycosyltransferase [Pseudomonadota bacterium]